MAEWGSAVEWGSVVEWDRSSSLMDCPSQLLPGHPIRAIRKAYIVHEGMLYSLSFLPYQSENETANAQLETSFASVTSSRVWMSAGKPCPATD